jgi:hypothetical protein
LAIVLIDKNDRAVFICGCFQDICFLLERRHVIIRTNIITAVVFVFKYDLGLFIFVNITVDFFNEFCQGISFVQKCSQVRTVDTKIV